MGGALAFHLGLRYHREIGGIFTCSSFLNENSSVYSSLKMNKSQNNCVTPKLIMFHGNRDSLVPISWGKRTYDQLKAINVDAEFKELKNTMHELKAGELIEIQNWITTLLPPLNSDLAKL